MIENIYLSQKYLISPTSLTIENVTRTLVSFVSNNSWELVWVTNIDVSQFGIEQSLFKEITV